MVLKFFEQVKATYYNLNNKYKRDIRDIINIRDMNAKVANDNTTMEITS